MFLILCSFIIILCYLLWNTYFGRKPTDPPEMSGKLPFIGNSLRFTSIGSTEQSFNTIISISKECMEKGGVLKAEVGFRSIYVVTDPEDCVTISNDFSQKGLMYTFVKPFLGEGLITGNGTTWKRHRKLLNPAFSQTKINNFIGIFNNESRRLVDQMNEMVGIPFNHEHLLRIHNLNTICITAAGLDSEEYKEIRQLYLNRITYALNLVTKRFRKIWLHNETMFSFSNLKRDQDEKIGGLLKLTKTIIQNKKRDLKMNVQKEKGEVQSFLDYVLEMTEKTGCFTDDEIREETDTIIAAGHDTSANILTSTLILLGSHLDVQEKVYQEIKKVVGDIDRDVNKDDLNELVYTDAVLKETLRLYPVTPVLERHADRELKLKNCTLQPNTGIFIFLWGLHRDPIWGPDAHEFKPERWLNTDTLPDMNYFGGFGLGRRGCIGKVYAMVSMKTTLVHIIRKFKLSADISKVTFKFEFLFRIAEGDHLTISPRNPEN